MIILAKDRIPKSRSIPYQFEKRCHFSVVYPIYSGTHKCNVKITALKFDKP